MKVEKPYPELFQLFGGYFNRDYDLVTKVDRNKPLFPQLIQQYKEDSPSEDTDKAITELEEIINKHYNSTILENLFNELGNEFDVSFYGYTHQQFLIEMLKLLKE